MRMKNLKLLQLEEKMMSGAVLGMIVGISTGVCYYAFYDALDLVVILGVGGAVMGAVWAAIPPVRQDNKEPGLSHRYGF